MFACWLLPAVAYIALAQEPQPRWRAAYFADADFEGTPTVRQEGDVDHDWGPRGSSDHPGDNGFAVRWDTCLSLEGPKTIAFQLTSETGARLLVDGRAVIDDWEAHPRHTRGVETTLEAGTHHLRVDYRGGPESASVVLAASFDGERPARIDPERLHFPDGETQRPCTAAPAVINHPPDERRRE